MGLIYDRIIKFIYLFIYLFINFAKRPGSLTEQALLRGPEDSEMIRTIGELKRKKFPLGFSDLAEVRAIFRRCEIDSIIL